MRSATLFVAALFLTASAALAGPDNRGTQGLMFDPNADDFGVLTTDSPEVLDPFALSLGLILDRARNPVESGNRRTQRNGNLVRESSVVNFVGALGLPFNLSLGFQIPFSIDQDGFELNQPNQQFDAVGLGDIRLDLKWQAFVSESRQFSMGLELFGSIPSGEPEDFRSDDNEGTVGALLLAEHRWDRIRVLAELGYQWIEEDARVGGVTFDDRLLFGLAIEGTLFRFGDDNQKKSESENYDVEKDRSTDAADANIEVQNARNEIVARLALDSAFRAEAPRQRQSSPIEVLYSLAFRARQGWSFEVGGGTGLSAGVGAPDYRFFAALRFSFGGSRPRSTKFENSEKTKKE